MVATLYKSKVLIYLAHKEKRYIFKNYVFITFGEKYLNSKKIITNSLIKKSLGIYSNVILYIYNITRLVFLYY